MQLLNNTLADEVKTALPFILVHVTSAVVASLVFAIKLVGMGVPFILPTFGTLFAFNYSSGCLMLLKLAESLEAESMGLLDDLRVDVGKKLKSSRLAGSLTRSRPARYQLGHFMSIESGTALACAMTVLDNIVSGIVMVVPTNTYYLLDFFS